MSRSNSYLYRYRLLSLLDPLLTAKCIFFWYVIPANCEIFITVLMYDSESNDPMCSSARRQHLRTQVPPSYAPDDLFLRSTCFRKARTPSIRSSVLLSYELKGDISPPCRKSFCGKPLTLSELNEQVDEACTRDHYDDLGELTSSNLPAFTQALPKKVSVKWI